MCLRMAILKPIRAKSAVEGNRQMNERITVAMTVFVAAVMLMIASCQRKPVMAHSSYVHLPTQGWLKTTPLTFSPEYDDSLSTYSLVLAIRHNNSYRYRNLSLVVDLIAVDSVVSRKMVNMQLADEYDNWTGGGFGTLYQDTVLLAGVIDPGDAESVVVWQAMQQGDTLKGVTDIGLIVRPL